MCSQIEAMALLAAFRGTGPYISVGRDAMLGENELVHKVRMQCLAPTSEGIFEMDEDAQPAAIHVAPMKDRAAGDARQ